MTQIHMRTGTDLYTQTGLFRRKPWENLDINRDCCLVWQDPPPPRVTGSEDIPWRFQPWLWPWPWGQQSKIVTLHSCLWWRTTIPSFRLQMVHNFRRLVFLGSESTLWPWPWRLDPKLFAWHSRSWWCVRVHACVYARMCVCAWAPRDRKSVQVSKNQGR